MTRIKNKILLLLFLIIVTSPGSSFAKHKWLLIYQGRNHSISIDINGLKNFTGNDFYVWAETINQRPISIEGISNNVYKVRTYYHFNKKLKRYSMIIIIYYDKLNNVLKSFNYRIKSKLKDYQFNFPIIIGSDEQKIFNASMGIINNLK